MKRWAENESNKQTERMIDEWSLNFIEWDKYLGLIMKGYDKYRYEQFLLA